MRRNSASRYAPCGRALSCPLGDSGAGLWEGGMLSNGARSKAPSLPESSAVELERLSFRPAARLFWSSPTTRPWTCNLFFFWKGQTRNMREFKAVLLKTSTLSCRSMSDIKPQSDAGTCNLTLSPFYVRIRDRKRGCNHRAVSLAPEHSSTVLPVFSGPVSVNKLWLHRLEKAFICLECILVPGCRGKKWLQHKASNKYLRSQASADNKPDWINSIEIALRLFPGKINTYRSYIGMI